MSWKEARERAEKGGSDGWITLSDGESVKLAVVGEPYSFWSVFGDEKHQELDYKPMGGQFRTRFNVAHFGDKELKMKRWELSKTTFKALDKAVEKYGQDVIFEVTREGVDLQTKYSILYDDKLTEDQKKAIAGLEVLGLRYEDFKQDDEKEAKNATQPPENSDIPF